MAEPFYKSPQHVGAWAQPGGPNTTMYYLGCVGLDDITEAGGEINTLFRCYTPQGKWVTRGATRNLPEAIEITVTELLPKTASWLETIKQGADCPFPFYINIKSCPPNDVFGGADRWWTLEKAYVGSATLSDMLSMEDEVAPKVAFALSAEPPMVWGHAIVSDRITFAGTNQLNDIASCSTPACGGACGDAVAACDTLVAVGDHSAGSADVWISYDNGVTWTTTAVDPYSGVATALMGVECFAISSTVTRIIVVREAVATAPAGVYYSDDWGANWTEVLLTTPVNYGATRHGALFVMDPQHIWVVVHTAGASEVHFSSDWGATWTEQGAPPAGAYTSIWFTDENNGMITGTNDVVAITSDGGATWTAATATGTTDGIVCCTDNAGGGTWWIGTASNHGSLYYSTDHGTTWTRRRFPGDGVGAVYGIDFVTPTVGYMTHSPTNATALIYRTRDGGFTWEVESGTAPGELFSVLACGVNDAFAVGEVNTTALVYKVHD